MRLAIGLVMTLAAFAVAGRRVHYLYGLIGSGQPAPGRLDGIGARARSQLREVFGQRKLLQWSVPGVAHFFTFWAFIVLAATILEAYGALFDRDFAIPVIGHWPLLGFLEDFFGLAVLVSIATFTAIRLTQAPSRKQRRSRFYGSHTGAAWLVLFMIFNVIWTLFLYRGAQVNTGVFPYGDEAFVSQAVASWLEPLGHDANEALETIGILLQIGVVLGFLVLVVYSKHLHIFLAPLNVLTKREPNALGPLQPIMVDGKPVDFENLDELDEDTVFGRGKVEDFTWKGMLDFATCTECGRCQDQCPAWNTGKPLSPKMVIMDLRDHLFAKGAGDEAEAAPPAGRHRRAGRRDRPGRAVVVHHLRRLRGAVPGRHRARRPHRRPAPVPGAGRVVVPVRGGHDAEEPGEQGQPVGHVLPGPPRVDPGPGLRGPRPRPGRRGPRARSTTCTGSAAPAPSRTGRRRRPARSPSCCTSPA